MSDAEDSVVNTDATDSYIYSECPSVCEVYNSGVSCRLKEAVKDLLRTNRYLQEQIIDTSQKLSRRRQYVDQCVNNQKRIHKTLTRSILELTEENARLKAEVATAQLSQISCNGNEEKEDLFNKQFENLKQSIEKLSTARKISENESKNMKEKYENNIKELTEILNNKEAIMRTHVETTKNEISNYQDQIRQLILENNSYSKQVESLNLTNTRIVQDNYTLQQQLMKKNSANVESNQINNIKEIEKLKQEIQSLRDKEKLFQHQLELNQKDYDYERCKKDALARELQQTKQKLAQYERNDMRLQHFSPQH